MTYLRLLIPLCALSIYALAMVSGCRTTTGPLSTDLSVVTLCIRTARGIPIWGALITVNGVTVVSDNTGHVSIPTAGPVFARIEADGFVPIEGAFLPIAGEQEVTLYYYSRAETP